MVFDPVRPPSNSARGPANPSGCSWSISAAEEIILTRRLDQVHHKILLAVTVGRIGEGSNFNVDEIVLNQPGKVEVQTK